MEKNCQLDIIHIDGLPEDLINKILTRLPIKDAIVTSVLSKKWRYAWTEVPQLVFDDKSCEELAIKTKDKIIMAIHQVLLLHRGPLDLFKLSLSNLESCPEIDQFVLVVLKSGVKNFFLYIRRGKPYVMPSSIFAYGQQLESLDFCFCIFKPPTGFDGFSKLVRLTLKEVGISGSIFSSLISKCPLLNHLVLMSYTNCGRLDIIAPNLEEFGFEGLCESICFTNTPKLATVCIVYDKYAYRKIEEHSQFVLCGRLPAVKRLVINSFYSKYMTTNGGKASLFNDLRHLQNLYLYRMCFGFLDEVSSALCLVKNAKNLSFLSITAITVHTEINASDLDLTKVEGISDVALKHLKKCNLLNVSDSKCELQFIELILTNSPVLEKCFVKTNFKLVGEKGRRFYEEVLRFRRASPFVEIVYRD